MHSSEEQQQEQYEIERHAEYELHEKKKHLFLRTVR
jgi:hypothetical protein